SAARATLKELTRSYTNLVEDTTRVMLRLKALFRARGLQTRGQRVYHPRERAAWLAQLADRGAQVRAEVLYAGLDVLCRLRPRAKAVMVAEARRDPAWAVLGTIPFFGPVRVALLLATMQTPWRFRTKRNLWAYAGLAVVTRSSAEYAIVAGRPVRGAVSSDSFARPAVTPRYLANSRPPRRTRTSVRPAGYRVSDRTVARARACDPSACDRPVWIGSSSEETDAEEDCQADPEAP